MLAAEARQAFTKKGWVARAPTQDECSALRDSPARKCGGVPRCAAPEWRSSGATVELGRHSNSAQAELHRRPISGRAAPEQLPSGAPAAPLRPASGARAASELWCPSDVDAAVPERRSSGGARATLEHHPSGARAAPPQWRRKSACNRTATQHGIGVLRTDSHIVAALTTPLDHRCDVLIAGSTSEADLGCGASHRARARCLSEDCEATKAAPYTWPTKARKQAAGGIIQKAENVRGNKPQRIEKSRTC